MSVASGTAALGRFTVTDPGRVLFYGAEDGPAQLRARIEGIAAARDLALEDLDLCFILAPSLRLDTPRDRDRLVATIEHHRPRLLVLDPLVRLHRIDENSAADISALLAELRVLQRRYDLALVLVHHLRKNGGASNGQALRGSGDLHAWGDSNLFLRRRERHLLLTAEHRSAPAPPPCTLELACDPAPHLRTLDDPGQDPELPDLVERILVALAVSTQPQSREALRSALRTRNASLGEALVQLRAQGHIERRDGGFALHQATPIPVPVPKGGERERNET